MQCPVDGTTLEKHTINSITVEECVQCGGLWFGESEFEEAKDASGLDLNWLDFDLWSDQELLAADWSSRKCPQCGKNMASISYASTGVTVDYCTDEHGVWLDKGEFQAIIGALEAEVSSKDVQEYVAVSLEEAKELVTGDKGFISEWEDFRTVLRLLQYRVLIENPKLAELLSALQTSFPLK